MPKRIEYIDVFRGFALFVMVSLHIFTYLSVSDIYTQRPFYVPSINSPTWLPPPLLFTFVSGMSIFFLLKKRQDQPKIKTFADAIKRYGKYVLISLPFTAIMFGLPVYFGWNEAIQGIGLTAVFAALFLLLAGQDYLASLIAIFASAALRVLLMALPVTGIFAVDLLENAFFKGWFSVLNLFPLMIGGIMMLSLIRKKEPFSKLFAFGASFLVFSLLLHVLGMKINYYDHSFAFTFYAIGEAALIYAFMYLIYKKSENFGFWRFFKVLGVTAFFVYITHFLFIVKVLQLLNVAETLPDSYSLALTVPIVLTIYLLAERYAKIKGKLPSFLRL